MPRVNGVMQLPPGTYGAPGTKVSSAKYNTAVDDFVAEMNGARPITAGGTGGTTAAAAREALEIVEKVLRYDAAQTLTGTDLTQAQANLRAILAGVNLGSWYEPAGFRITGATGAAWMWELPTDAKEWRLTARGLRNAAGAGSLTLRCGAAGGSAEAGASDYYNQRFVLLDGVQDIGGVAQSGMAPGTTGPGNLPRRIEISGSLGSADDPWTAVALVNAGSPSGAEAAMRFSFRQANGRKPRIFLTSNVAMVAGELIMEART